MGKYMDWFEVEFRKTAKARGLSPEKTASILESLREHVGDAVDDRRAFKGDEEAERLAVKNLGSPLDIVLEVQDAPRKQWWPVWIAVAGLVWSAICLISGSKSWSLPLLTPVLWLTPLLVLIASVWSKRIKLWALFGVTSGAVATTLAIVSFTWLDMESAGGMGLCPVWNVAKETKEAGLWQSAAKRQIDHFKRQRSAFAVGDQELASKLAKSSQGWLAPSGSIKGQFDPDLRVLPTFEAAREQWDHKARPTLAALERTRGKYETSIAALNSPKAWNPMRVFMETLPSMMIVMLGCYLVLAISHLLGLGIAAVPRVLARRHWRTVI